MTDPRPLAVRKKAAEIAALRAYADAYTPATHEEALMAAIAAYNQELGS